MKTIGSLFAGIGGFDLGFEREGFRTAWAVEIDQKAQAVLRRHFPSAALHDDVCQVGSHNLGPVDVVTFGSPCRLQGWKSVHGIRMQHLRQQHLCGWRQ